ncbi:MAG TPA: Crp/Fnr family transcriptional regulator [Bacteroidales bacterium]|nr:MAG: cAMP receptor protein [Bacteroidetes bacterium ADurb.Bin217]HPH15605.1 Crp/Fnr family transcriptional regulator [Bacteroidales bacterium]HPM11919.1 Crp/Fnr family transcriptional regulator [Bacteroidales bacterium]
MKELEKNIQLLLQVFPMLTETEKELLLHNCHVVEFNQGETIFKEGTITSHIYFINHGLIKLVREHKNNRTIVLDIVPDAKFFGFVSLLGAKQYDVTAKAIEQSSILTIYFDAFKEIMLSNPQFTLQIMTVLSKQNLLIVNHLICISQKQLPGRVADVLLFFYKLYETTEFAFPIGRRELAEFAGTSKESFIRTLSEFKTDKIIDILDSRSIQIHSIEILEKLSIYG